ncbi:Ribose import ATP-binding protein RbsA 2 OS=Streptomyces fumanus OX=67302 GN=rbsA2 PE=4 SV=1 [Streptomyces fumanus]
MLSGAHTPDAGRILVGGEEVRVSTGAQDAERLGIATIYQEFNLVPDLTVAETSSSGGSPGGSG